MNLDVIALGNTVLDVIARRLSFHPRWGTEFGSNNSVLLSEPISVDVGGNAGNFVVTFARLGGKPGVISAVGNDYSGRIVLEALEKNSVEASHVRVYRKAATTVSVLLVDRKGYRSSAHFIEGADCAFRLDRSDFEYVANAKFFYLCSYFLQKGIVGNPALDIVRYAKKKGTSVAFDIVTPNWMGITLRRLEKILKFVDIFFPNITETKMLTGKCDVRQGADVLLGLGPSMVVVKMGKRGCLVATKHEKIRMAGFLVKKSCPIGAGDSFNAGFIYALSRKWDMKEAARFGNAVAAISLVSGACSVPSERGVRRFINETKQSR